MAPHRIGHPEVGLQSVVFDSSFLMAVGETPTPWSEDITDGIGKFSGVLPDCVRSEMERIARGQGKRARAARVGLELASGFLPHPCGKAGVDDEISALALDLGAYVATVDSGLAESLKASHVKVISLAGGRVSLP